MIKIENSTCYKVGSKIFTWIEDARQEVWRQELMKLPLSKEEVEKIIKNKDMIRKILSELPDDPKEAK